MKNIFKMKNKVFVFSFIISLFIFSVFIPTNKAFALAPQAGNIPATSYQPSDSCPGAICLSPTPADTTLYFSGDANGGIKYSSPCNNPFYYKLSSFTYSIDGGATTSFLTVQTQAGDNGMLSCNQAGSGNEWEYSFTNVPVNVSGLTNGIHTINISANDLATNTTILTGNINFTVQHPTYTVTPSAVGSGSGTITPNTPQTVNTGSTTSFNMNPSASSSLAGVLGSCPYGALNGNNYTTGPITANCTVVANFSLNSYTVTGTAGSNGTISPASNVVNYGSTTTFTVTPNSGYTASASGCGGSLFGTTYTTGIITGNCTVTASFSLNSVNDASFVSQSVATTMNTNATQNVSVTMKNIGTTTWTAANSYRLGSQNPQDNTTWQVARVLLAGGDSIAPNQSKTFSFTITAPATPGTYHFQWKMVQDGVQWFGGSSTNVDIVVSTPTMSGTLTPPTPTCTILLGSSTCNVSMTWTTLNPQGTSQITSSYPSNNTVLATGNSGTNVPIPIPYLSSPRVLYLYNNSVLLDQSTATASCTLGTSWNGSICVNSLVNGVCGSANGKAYSYGTNTYSPDLQCSAGNSNNPIFPTAGNTTFWVCQGLNGGSDSGVCSASQDAAGVTLIANPISISSGGSSILTWTSNASSCTGTNFIVPLGVPNGSTSVSPSATTLYTVTCGGANASATVKVAKKPIYIEH